MKCNDTRGKKHDVQRPSENETTLPADRTSLRGALAEYATPALIKEEEGAWEHAMIEKHSGTNEIMNRGMNCLTEQLGVIDAERFIAAVIREQFDYTEWQRRTFDALGPDAFHQNAVEYAKEHPYRGKAEIL